MPCSATIIVGTVVTSSSSMIRGFVSATYAHDPGAGRVHDSGHDREARSAPRPLANRPGRVEHRARRSVAWPRCLGLRARLTAPLARARSSPATYRTITAVALVAAGRDRRVGRRGAPHRVGHGLPHLADLRGRLARAPGRHRRQRLDRVREPHCSPGLVSVAVALAVLGARRLRSPTAPTSPAGRGASSPACSPRRCSAGSSWCSHVDARWRWPATTCCRRCSSPTPWCSTTRPASPTGTRRARSPRPPLLQRSPRARGAWPALVLVTGTLVTGSGPHSGDDAADRLPVRGGHRRPDPQR